MRTSSGTFLSRGEDPAGVLAYIEVRKGRVQKEAIREPAIGMLPSCWQDLAAMLAYVVAGGACYSLLCLLQLACTRPTTPLLLPLTCAAAPPSAAGRTRLRP